MESNLLVKKILITGGSGFIGTNLVESFLAAGHKVLNIDINFSIGEWEKITRLQANTLVCPEGASIFAFWVAARAGFIRSSE